MLACKSASASNTNVLRLVAAFFALVIPAIASYQVHAAEITFQESAPNVVIIRVEGDIKSGDEERFRQISLRHPQAVVHLESNGGALVPALEIGRIIRIAGYTTVVMPNTSCISACALMWLAGKKRYLLGQAGFHAAYRTSDGQPQESGAANALIGNYMTQLGLPTKAILFATAAPPDKILWLTVTNKDEAGIDFEPPVAPPAIQLGPKPAPDQVAPAPAPAVIIPPPSKRNVGVRVLEREFFLTDVDGQDLYIVTFLHRGLKLRYPIPLSGDVESALIEFFEDELHRKDGWINIYLSGDINKKDLVGFDIHEPTISRSGQLVEVWIRQDHEFDKNVRHRTEVIFAKFYCRERSVSLLEATKYDPQGKILSSEDFSGLKARIAPNTVFEPIYDAVCP